MLWDSLILTFIIVVIWYLASSEKVQNIFIKTTDNLRKRETNTCIIKPPEIEANRHVSSSSGLTRRSLRETYISDYVSSQEKYFQKYCRGIISNPESSSVKYGELKNHVKEATDKQNYESCRTDSLETSSMNCQPNIKSQFSESKTKTEIVNSLASQQSQKQTVSAIKKKGFKGDIRLLGKDEILQSKTKTTAETCQNAAEEEFPSPQPLIVDKLPVVFSAHKGELNPRDKTHLPTTQDPKEGKTSSLDLPSTSQTNSTSSATLLTPSYSPITLEKRNNVTSENALSPGHHGSSYNYDNSVNYKDKGYSNDFKSIYADKKLNKFGKSEFGTKYMHDCKIYIENEDSTSSIMDLDDSRNLDVDSFCWIVDDVMESTSDMLLNSEMDQDVLDVAEPDEPSVRQTQKLASSLFSRYSENKDYFRLEDAMMSDDNIREVIHRDKTPHGLKNPPESIARTTYRKLNTDREITLGNQNFHQSEVPKIINRQANLGPMDVSINLTEQNNLNPYTCHTTESEQVSQSQGSHQEINKTVTANKTSDTRVSLSGGKAPPGGHLRQQVASPTQSAGNSEVLNMGVRQGDQLRENKTYDSVLNVGEKKKRSGISEELELVNGPETKKTKLVTITNYSAKRKAKWCEMKKAMRNFKDSCNKENDQTTKVEASRVEVLGKTCWVCGSQFEHSAFTRCPCKHQICLQCIQTVIKNFIDTKDQKHLTCPIESCKEIIDIDHVTKELNPLTLELLESKLIKRQKRANEIVEEYLFQKISCLGCNEIATMDKKAIHFKCRKCSKEFCSYCHKDWPGINSHMECRLLNYSGSKCLQQLHVAPDNWEESYSVLTAQQDNLNSASKSSFVDLNRPEGRAIISLFIQTSPNLWITKIIRLQNLKLWEKYVLKRRHMVDEIGVSNISERALFHGTNEKNISLISEEGFDMRIETANGNLFGKGTYFSTTSRYSLTYAGSSNKMFIARVLCGQSTLGKPEYKRPPKDKSGRMYDSCVNYDSTIYCLFDNSQYYPAYVIEYTKKK